MFNIPLKLASKFWTSDDDPSLDEDVPAIKRLKSLQRTTFPDLETMNDDFDLIRNPMSKVRYVPIQIERGPSTSTPNLHSEKTTSRVRNVPIRLVDVTENSPRTEIRKPRMHTPIKPTIVQLDNEDDDDDEITLIESKRDNGRKSSPQVFINLDDEDEENEEQPQDVIFVKKINSPKPASPQYKFFVSKNDRHEKHEDRSPQFYRVLQQRKVAENMGIKYQKNKFKTPVGVTKNYKKAPTPLPKWMQPFKPVNQSDLSQSRSRYQNVTGNARSALSEVFNLDEKRNYQELIRRVTGSNPLSQNRPVELINLTDDSASFRSTILSQKRSLDEIRFVERGLASEREAGLTQEYDPITVASINSSDSEVEIVPSEASTSSSVRIDRVNSLKDSHKDNAVTSNDWLANIDSKYRKKRLETQEKLKDARRESDIISKVNYEQKLAHLEHKLKYELSIPESLIEEPTPEVELPELTLEQEKLVNRALGPGPPGQLLVEKFNLRIHRRDLQTLAGLNWLNDEVINFYMNLLMQRSQEKQGLPKVYAANTFFYPKLMQGGQAGLRRWTRKVDIFAHDLMVLPVHLGVHWCLSFVDFKKKRICYLDSMGGRNQACLDALMQYLKDEHKDKKGAEFDASGWKKECLSKDIPQQMNGSDCGMFACTFAEFESRGAPYSFSQQHMPYLRRKMALEILQGQLLL